MSLKKVFISTSLLFIIFCGNVYGVSDILIFFGIQPAITVEPFYQKGEFDVNVFPLVLEIPIGQRINFRLLPMVNYHLGGKKKGFSDQGFFTVFPFFFKNKETVTTLPYGIYVGPVFGFGRNLINNHYTATFAIEPGYMFKTKSNFTIVLGCQFGGSYFFYDFKPNKWIFHFGPKVTFGFWFERNGPSQKVLHQIN